MKLRIQNFQKHKDLKLDLSYPITTIVGPSDSGKSAIIRALRWLVFNKPSGISFIKDGEKESRVAIKNGHILSRIRSANKNLYKIDNTVFEAFGSDVPPEISNTLNLGEINFQSQHDSPFWFSDTAGEVSRQMNQTVGLGIIDQALSKSASGTRIAKTNVTLTENRTKEAEQEYENLLYVEEMRDEFNDIDTQHKSLQKLEDKINTFSTVIKELIEDIEQTQFLEGQIQEGKLVIELGIRLENVKEYKESLLEIVQNISTYINKSKFPIQKIKKQFDKLYKQNTDISDRDSNIKKLSQCIQIILAREEKANEDVPDISELESLSKNLIQTKERRTDLNEFLNELTNYEITIKNGTRKLKNAEKTYKELMGDRCPLCGSKVKSSKNNT